MIKLMAQKGNINIPILIIIIVASFVAYVFYDKGLDTLQLINLTQTGPAIVKQPTTSSSSAETANWKTYTNANYNFSFKYPSDWVEKTTISGISIKKMLSPHTAPFPDEIGIEVTVYKGSGNLTAEGFLRNIFYKDEVASLAQTYIKNAGIKPITIDDSSAEKINNLTYPVGPVGSGVWIKKDNNGIFLHFSLSSIVGQDKIYQNILSTFKFTP